MPIAFLRPLFLVLVPAVALLWFLPRQARDRVQRLMRAGVFLALLLALAQPVLLTSDRTSYEVFVVDRSASVSPARRAQQRAAVLQARGRAGRRDATALVLIGSASADTGEDAIDRSAFGAVIDVHDPLSPSPLGAAVAAAARRIPEGARGAIHLFTDGLSTDRRWAPDVQRVIERGITVHTYDHGLEDRDVYPAGITTSDLLRVGQTARVAVEVVGAARGVRVRLVGSTGDEIAASAPMDSDGHVTVPLTFEPRTPGFLDVTAQVVVAAGQDVDPGNNAIARTLAIQDPLRILYLGDRMRGGASRVAGLLGRGFEVTDGSSRELSAAFDLSAYDLVLLDDRPASKVPEAFQQRVADAVARQGLGFVFTGGRSAFGTGGYDATPVAQMVPVEFVQRTEKRDPSTALAIIIDTSGSMIGTRMELAKQVARLAVRRLKAHDRIGIVEFYGNKHWALPLQSAANKITIDRAIGRMQAIGGTVLMPALEEAYYGLKNVDTRYKHIVIITDAGVESSDYEGMVRQISKDGINVSTVLVGAQAHNQVMIDMASWGKGRFYSVADRYSLPELVLKQPSTMKLPAYKTGTFSVQSRGGEGWWSDVDRRSMPALDGYVETTMRLGAEVLMEIAGSEDPVIATWRYGLGRVTAVTTEPVGEGTRGWADWKEYGRLLARLATRTADDTRLFAYDLRRTDHVVTVDARRDSRDGTLYPEAAVLDDQGGEGAAVRFHQAAPGHFTAAVAIDPRAPVRLRASAHRAADPSVGHQPTRLISIAADDVAPERQVDPLRGLDLEALAGATGGAYTDPEALAADTLAARPPLGAAADARDSVAMFRLWPLLLVLGLLTYLAEITYRRWPSTARSRGASAARTSAAALFVLLALASPAFAQRQAPFSILTPARVDARVVERLYNDAIIKDGSPDGLVQRLADAARDRTKSRRYRANACLVRSHVLWRHGAIKPALAAADEGLAIEPYDDLVYHKARLLDAMGVSDQTREWYQKALSATTNPQLRERIRLRLTFADAIDQNVKGVVELARTRPREFRNRAAIALAILGFNNEAAGLYEVFGDGSERFRQHLRVAQWAIKGGDAARAQDASWQAARAATLDRDRRYALSLLVEAHTLDNSLGRLLERFAAQKTLTPEEEGVRIDLLRQTGQYQLAIDLFKSAHGTELDAELRQELLRMYRDAGQSGAMVAEYRQLIARDPGVIDWPEGLSQYYLEQGDQTGARRVWEDFLARTSDVNTLVFGADAMTSFGLHDLAIAATEKALAANTGVEDAARVRLAQFELYRHRGKNTEAEAALTALNTLLPADSPYRSELADAYERLQKPQLAARTLQALGAARGGLSVDETMRLAWLFDSTGRRDDALKLWRQLWTSETLAARRRLVEERLLLLAAELGSLGDLAVELEERLANRTATPRDVSLLVSIYTKVGDSVSAIEAVTSGAAQGGRTTQSEIVSLKEQAQIYLALNEYDDFTRVTRRLLEIDPAGKVDYLQSLLLNQLEAGADPSREPKDQTAELREYLARLRQVGGSAVGAEFEAGVMELAGFRDQAIDAYRRALALHPERADDHLLLADLLRQAGRTGEAVASLQYITESADADELFLIAIDGITNMRTGSAATLKWAERRALERLTERDDKLYLYEMLSDLAEEARDSKVYLASLENSLAHADSRRSHVLRELLAVTAEVTTFEGSQRVAGPDAKLNVTYARRLIALGEELPPEVYVDLGRTFIKMNDPASASRAFNLAVDRTGRSSVVLEAAKLFERGGYDREAAGQYEKALIAASGSIETILRLARLRERAGLVDTANELYLRGLQTIVSQQNRAVERGRERTPPLLDTLVTFEYRRYYQVLLTGFLATLPADAVARTARLRVLEADFDLELRQLASAAGPAGLEPLAYYPRLSILSRGLRAAAFSAGQPAPADRADAALRQYFGRDAHLAAEMTEERARWGFAAPESAKAPAPAPRTLDSADYLKAVGVALMRGDQDAALVEYRQWARFAGTAKPPLYIGNIQIADRSPGIPEVAQHAWQRLDERRFGSLAQHVHGLIADNDAYAEKILLDLVYQYETVDVPILTRLEMVVGKPLVEPERMLRLVSRMGDWMLLNLQYVLAHLPPDRQIEVLERYGKATDVNWSRYLASFGVVLVTPLDAAQAARLAASVKNTLQNGLKRANGPAYLTNFMNYVVTTGVHPSNAPIVLDVEAFIAEKYPQQFKVGYFKAGLLRDIGRDAEAVAAFVDAALAMYVPLPQPGTIITSGTPSPYAYQSFVRTFVPFIFPKHKALVWRLLDEREKGPEGLTDALISLRIELNNNDPAGDPQQFMAALQAMADRNPKNEQVLNTLFPLYDQWGDSLKAAAVLARLQALRPEDRSYRYRLAMHWQKLDRPEKVVEVIGTDTVQSLAPVVPRNYYIESLSGPAVVRFPGLKRAVDQIKAAKDGGNAQEAAQGLRTLLQTLPPSGMSLNEYSQTRDAADPYLYIRDLLTIEGETPARPAGAPAAPAATTRSVAVVAVPTGGAVAMTAIQPAGGVPAASAAAANQYARLVTSLESDTGAAAGAARPVKIMDLAVRYPFSVAELESYVNTLRADDVDRQYLFFEWLVDAYVNNSRAEAELERRTPAIRSGTAGRKDVTVWLGVASRQPGPRAREWLAAAEQGDALAGRLTGFQRLLLARLYAAAGRREQALDAYTSVATDILAGTAGTIQPNTLAVDPYSREYGLMLFTGLGLFDDARQRLDADAIGRFTAAMLAMSQPPKSPSVEQAYARFVLALYSHARQAGLSIAALQQTAGALEAGPGWTRPDVLSAVYARAQLGRVDEALALLQTALQRDLESREIFNATVSNAMFASRQYQMALGLIGDAQLLGPFVTAGQGIEGFKPLFAVKADGWPGAGQWVTRVAAELPGWIERRAVNRDAGVQLLSLVILRLHQMGDAAGAAAGVKALGDALRAGPVSPRTASIAVTVADKAGVPVELAVVQALVRANRLHMPGVLAAIARTEQAEGAAAALSLGAAAAEFTSNADLLKQLVAIAKAASNTAEAERWTSRQQEVAAARAFLAKK